MAMTDEQKKAASERMKAMHAAKAAQKQEPEVEKTVTIPEDKLNFIMEELARLKAEKPAQSTVTSRGVVGSQEKYSTNKSLYKDPRDRLIHEKEFSRFAVDENYNLYWDVNITRYQTAQGLWFTEPRFEIEVRKKKMSDDGELEGEYALPNGKLVMHEDWDAAIDIANSIGMEIDNDMGKDFIDEMRYQSMLMWFREVFFPPKTINTANTGKRDVVLGGRVVTFYENPAQLKDYQG